MIGAGVHLLTFRKRVEKATDKGAYRTFGHAAGSIRKDAVTSIRRRKSKRKASPPGTPPYTHGGRARKAARYDVTKTDAVIGFRHSVVGPIMGTHEEGLKEEGREYPERPTIGPALQRNLHRFHRDWRSSIVA